MFAILLPVFKVDPFLGAMVLTMAPLIVLACVVSLKSR